jgi:hypothetical protein
MVAFGALVSGDVCGSKTMKTGTEPKISYRKEPLFAAKLLGKSAHSTQSPHFPGLSLNAYSAVQSVGEHLLRQTSGVVELLEHGAPSGNAARASIPCHRTGRLGLWTTSAMEAATPDSPSTRP